MGASYWMEEEEERTWRWSTLLILFILIAAVILWATILADNIGNMREAKFRFQTQANYEDLNKFAKSQMGKNRMGVWESVKGKASNIGSRIKRKIFGSK